MDAHTLSTGQTLSTVGLTEAAAIFDVSVDTLRRRIKSGQMPEAVKVDGKFGAAYTLAVGDLPAIAKREFWTLNLDAIQPEASPIATAAQLLSLIHISEPTRPY